MQRDSKILKDIISFNVATFGGNDGGRKLLHTFLSKFFLMDAHAQLTEALSLSAL